MWQSLPPSTFKMDDSEEGRLTRVENVIKLCNGGFNTRREPESDA